MKAIPKKLKDEILLDPFYKTCALYGHREHVCEGRITFEHAIIFAGRQLQEKFAIIPLCAKAHEVDSFQDAGTMRKGMNMWVALNRARDEELFSISKAINYTHERDRLNAIYGIYEHKVPEPSLFANLESSSPKKEWYPISQKDKVLINQAKMRHFRNEGVRYSDHQMIAEMIRTYNTSLEIIEKLDVNSHG